MFRSQKGKIRPAHAFCLHGRKRPTRSGVDSDVETNCLGQLRSSTLCSSSTTCSGRAPRIMERLFPKRGSYVHDAGNQQAPVVMRSWFLRPLRRWDSIGPNHHLQVSRVRRSQWDRLSQVSEMGSAVLVLPAPLFLLVGRSGLLSSSMLRGRVPPNQGACCCSKLDRGVADCARCTICALTIEEGVLLQEECGCYCERTMEGSQRAGKETYVILESKMLQNGSEAI